MFVSKLRLEQFRNYPRAELELTSQPVFLLGDNAQGKTNLMEAIFLCAAGRSHRTSHERELIRAGAERAAVKLLVSRREGRQTVDFRINASAPRDIYINGIKTRRIGELMGHFNCVLFAPEDLDLVKEGPAVRRRFMDMELSQLYPAYFYCLQRYARALRQRGELLKAVEQKPSLLATLPAWDEQLAEAGAYIASVRRDFVRRISELAQEKHGYISGGRESLCVEYLPGTGPGDVPDAAEYMRRLAAARQTDLRRRTTSVGVHRDDIALRLSGSDIRAYGSQGQQRTAAIAMKLSELQFMRDELGQWPVLLLDDVLSELDQSRQSLLLRCVRDVQAFISGTSLEGAARLPDMRVLRVCAGALEEGAAGA